MNFDVFKRELVNHILAMADNPGFVDYAREKVREMVRQDPLLYGDLPEMLKQAMTEKNDAAA